MGLRWALASTFAVLYISMTQLDDVPNFNPSGTKPLKLNCTALPENVVLTGVARSSTHGVSRHAAGVVLRANVSLLA